MNETKTRSGLTDGLRKRSKEALGESERFARSIIDALSAHIAILDETGTIIAVNRPWREFAKANPPVLTNVCEGANYLEVCETADGPGAEESAAMAAGIRAVMRNEQQEFVLEYPCHCAQEKRWFNARVTRFTDDGAILIVVAHENISKRKRAEDALKRTERRLYETASRLPGMIFQFYARPDGSLGLHYVSEQAKRLLGLDPEPEGFFERFTAAFLPEYRDDFLKIVRKTISELSEWKYEGAMRKPSGEIVWISGLATPTKHDDEIIYDGVIIDVTERKRAEEKLVELKIAVEQSADGIALVDLDGHISFVNGTWARMHGYSVDELIGRHLGIFHTKEQLEAEVNPFIEQLQKTGSGEREIGHARKDGTTFPMWMSCTVLKGADQKPFGLIGTALDITERKRVEKMLRESETRYRTLFQNSADGILIADIETRMFMYANPAACNLLGYTEAELRKMGVADIIPKDDLPRAVAEFDAQVRGDKTLAADIPCLRKDGAIVYVDVSAAPMAVDGRMCNVGFFRDITAKKQVEETLAKTLQRQQDVSLLRQSLLAPAPLEAKFKMITDGIVRLFDADFCRIWLIRPGDLCQRDCMHAEVQEGPHVCRCRDRCLHLLASSGRYTHTDGKAHHRVPFGCYKIGCVASDQEHKFLTNDVVNDPAIHNHEWARELGLVSFAGYQLRAPGGETLGVLALFAKHPVASDEDAMLDGLSSTVAQVVQQAAAEEKLRLSFIDLERSNNELEQFAYVASHDLQEPLRMMSSYTQLLARRYRGRLDADADEFIAFAVDGANRMQKLINDLLAYSRVGTRGKGFEPTDCTGVLDQAIANLKAAIEESGAVVTHDPLPIVMADNLQLVQLFQNLIGNAIKFHGKEPLRVHVSAGQKENEWVISVRDNGIGIDHQYAERIFVIFQRLHTKEEYPGTGIGLAICKKIVERRGGRIWVESQPGIGSTFYFTIPIGGNEP
jgi:PAS domain S-box-containing protein